MGPRAVWISAENLVATGTRSLDRPAFSQSLYRLGYPAHLCFVLLTKHHLGDQIKNKMGEPCGTHGDTRDENRI